MGLAMAGVSGSRRKLWQTEVHHLLTLQVMVSFTGATINSKYLLIGEDLEIVPLRTLVIEASGEVMTGLYY